MPKLKVTLTQEWNKRTKKIDVSCDELLLGSVFNGETSEFEIAQGQHKLKVKSGWYGSKELTFSLRDHEVKAVNVAVFKYADLIISSLFVVIALHFIASTFFDIKFLVWLNIPAFLIMGYYLTFGRNDYLVITER